MERSGEILKKFPSAAPLLFGAKQGNIVSLKRLDGFKTKYSKTNIYLVLTLIANIMRLEATINSIKGTKRFD